MTTARPRPTTGAVDAFVVLTAARINQERELSLAGLVRWILEPLSFMVVYAVFVGAILARPRQAFPLFILAALIPFRMFTETVNESMTVLKGYSTIIGNRSFPRAILPPVVVASNVPTFVLSLLLFVPFMVAYDVPVRGTIVWLPVVVAILLLLTTAGSYIGALLGLYLPDFRGAIQNLLRVSFFASTGLYTHRQIPGDTLPGLITANPLSSVFDGFRSSILFGLPPNIFDLVYPTAFGLVALAVGMALYRWREREFAKET
ncbi:MAG: ABC transporter permease [Actinomycetota bacterium]